MNILRSAPKVRIINLPCLADLTIHVLKNRSKNEKCLYLYKFPIPAVLHQLIYFNLK